MSSISDDDKDQKNEVDAFAKHTAAKDGARALNMGHPSLEPDLARRTKPKKIKSCYVVPPREDEDADDMTLSSPYFKKTALRPTSISPATPVKEHPGLEDNASRSAATAPSDR